jgi:hypothetical protein
MRSKPYFFAFETNVKPGKLIAHCVRFETVELDAAQSDLTEFTLLGVDIEHDKRIKQMIESAHSFKENNSDCFSK